MIRSMQYALHHTHAAASRVFVWVGLIVTVTLVAEVFAAGASAAFGDSSAHVEYVAPPLSRTALDRTCWPIEAGVDAQCIDAP